MVYECDFSFNKCLLINSLLLVTVKSQAVDITTKILLVIASLNKKKESKCFS